MSYTFLTTGDVSIADLEQLILLTQSGALRWLPADHAPALAAGPSDAQLQDDQEALAAAIGANLHGIRLGYVHDTYRWHYLRLIDARGRQHHLDVDQRSGSSSVCNSLYQLAQKAARLGGTLVSAGDAEHYCAHCEHPTSHRALCDRPYGLPGAIMSGSERLVCTICEHSQSLVTTSP